MIVVISIITSDAKMRVLALILLILLPALAFAGLPPAPTATPPATTLSAKNEAGLTAADRAKFEERGRALEAARFRQRDRNRALFFAGIFLLLSGYALTMKESTRELARFWLVINGLTAFFVGSTCLNALVLGSLFFDDPHASYRKYLVGWGLPLLISIAAYFSAQSKFSQNQYLQSTRLSLWFMALTNVLIVLLILKP